MTEDPSANPFLVRVFRLSTGSVIAESFLATPTEAVDHALDLMTRYPPPAYEVTIFSAAAVTKQEFAELTDIAQSADLNLQVAPWNSGRQQT